METAVDLHQALSQLDVIHAQVSRTEAFRGYRPLTVGAQGLLALTAAGCQAIWLPAAASNFSAWLQLWIAIAAIAITIVSVDLAIDCWRSPSQFARRQTWQAIEQFLPCIAAGGALTWALFQFAPASLPLLPGLWAIVFGLGVCSASRQLPPAVIGVAIYYLLAGLCAIALARGAHAFSPWAMAGTFGVGQLLTAWVLHANRQHEAVEAGRG
jgi:hypothetical protein